MNRDKSELGTRLTSYVNLFDRINTLRKKTEQLEVQLQNHNEKQWVMNIITLQWISFSDNEHC